MKNAFFKIGLIVLVFLLIISICRWAIIPQIQKIPADFSYQATVFSIDNFYDESEKRFSGEVTSVTKFSYESVEKDDDGDLLIKNGFDVRKPSGEKIFTVERLYAINPLTGEHVEGKGDKTRHGCLFAPKNIQSKQDFTYWHINYDAPALMKFQGEETIAGLNVYHYACSYKADQTNNLHFLAGVPKERGVELDILLETWIDPVTGWLIKYTDHATAWYYDIQSHQRLQPWNKFYNEFTQSSILHQVEIAKNKKQLIEGLKIYLPAIFALITCCLLLFYWFKEKHYKDLLPVFTALLIVGTVTGIGWWFYNSQKSLQLEKHMEQFEADASKTLSYIKSKLDDSNSALEMLRYDYGTYGAIDRKRFGKLAHHLLMKSDNMQALAYCPVITQQERKAYEELARKEGYLNFQFTEGENGKNLVKAAERSLYVPIYFIEPYKGNENALGYDLLSDTIRKTALQLAEKSGGMVATKPLLLVQLKEKNKQGMIIFNPVLKAENELTVTGFFSGVYILDNLINSAISSHDVNKEMKLEIVDITDKNRQKLFSTKDIAVTNCLVITKQLPVLNRTWELNFYLPPVPSDKNGIALLIIGIMLSLVTGALAFLVLGNKTKELKESNDRFFSIFDSNSVGMGITSLESGKFEFVNEVLAKIIGYPKDELIGKSARELNFINPEIREKALAALKNSQELKDIEMQLKRRNGETIWVLSSSKVLKIKDQKFVLTSFHDISARKKIQEELHQSKELFSSLFNHNPAAISIRRTSDAKILNVNSGYLELLGFESIEEAVEFEASDTFTSPGKVDEIRVMLKRNKVIKNLETLVHNKRGEKLWLSTSMVVLKLDKEICVLAVSIDITERKKMEQELIKAKQIAEEAVILKEAFLANMSHEIRTPMNAIIGFTDLLLKRNLASKEKDYVQTIKNSGENLLRIINDILDVSKINSGMMEFEAQAISLTDLFSSLNIMLLQKAKEKNLELIFEYNKDLPDSILGDPTRLTQIILNLVSNAIKFTKKGGVYVSANIVKEEGDVYLIEFSVRDTGIGVPEDKLQSIFERFSQAESHTTRNYGGTGLGLSIAKQLVTLQGGTIKVESKVGTGSVFTFTLPFKKTSMVQQEQQAHYNDSDIFELSKLNILLVEDNAINVKFLKSLFSEYNIKSVIAENGKQAVEQVKNNDFDLILMDIEMPEMNGFEATSIIRNELQNRIPIIAITANAMAGEQEKCLQLGMNDYISKPIDADLLFEKMLDAVNPDALAKKTLHQKENVAASKQLINLAFLIKSMRGKKEIIRETIDIFIEQVPLDMDMINEGVSRSDYVMIKSAAHKMKSTFSLAGAQELMPVLEKMELLAKEKRDMDQIKKLNETLNILSNQALSEMKTERFKYE